MIEDISFFGYFIFFFIFGRVILQIVRGVIRVFLKKKGTPIEDEYHRLYEESMEWMYKSELKTSK
ncbi:hypothetical protein [Methanosarcina sp. 2.H.A.1B.4]|uniref:hypothetical protein n=1 Tax=Methanosarcina sp. 2.H.A.1B.4 TaxID=1483600 RepID=UPI000AB4DAA4|nr:hypothetical protein [Methanosarcina sp. 2.H.A.1B.4]